MIQEKILELLGYGFSIERIAELCLDLYNKNPFEIDNFEKFNFLQMKKLVKDTILLYSVFSN